MSKVDLGPYIAAYWTHHIVSNNTALRLWTGYSWADFGEGGHMDPDACEVLSGPIEYQGKEEIKPVTHDHVINKQAKIINALEAVLKTSRLLMFRITNESVPLFGSDRLHNLHKQCREHLTHLTEALAISNGTKQP